MFTLWKVSRAPERSERLHNVGPSIGKAVVRGVRRKHDGQRAESPSLAPSVDQLSKASIDGVFVVNRHKVSLVDSALTQVELSSRP